MAAGFGIGIATVYRYVREAVEALALRATTREQATTAANGKAYVIVDGTLLRIDQIVAGLPFYTGKHRKYGIQDPAIR